MNHRIFATGALLACLMLTAEHRVQAQNADEVMRANFSSARLAAELAGESLAEYSEPIAEPVETVEPGAGPVMPSLTDSFSGGCCPQECCSDGCCPQRGFLNCCGACRTGPCGRNVQFFAGAEYIYARASFSEAVAYVINDISNINRPSNQFVEYDFGYNSSYSFYGGVRFCDCGAALVFDFDRFESDAAFGIDNPNINGVTIFGPYEVNVPVNGSLQGSANVRLDSYDIAVEKTIPLGGCRPCCNPCNDTCCGGCDGGGCDDTCCGGCDSCCCWCPLWDITWSAGFRAADVVTGKGSTAIDASQNAIRSYNTTMDFEGYGGRIGLEGRRYIGRNPRFSLYAKGDISVLVGDMNYSIVENDITGGIITTTTASGRRVIPVTEVEAGASVCLGKHVQASAGYFIGAWHDLGFRDEASYGALSGLLDSFDDANILGLDGFFARVEVAF